MAWHCFLDTRLFFEKREDRDALVELADETQTVLYVPETAVIERRTMIQLKEGPGADLTRMNKIVASCGPTIPIAGATPEELADMVSKLAAARADLKFRDATILLSCLRYAADKGLRSCMAVVEDKEFYAAFQVLTRDAGTWLLYASFEDLRKALKASPDVAARLQEFMGSWQAIPLTYLTGEGKPVIVDAVNVHAPGIVDVSTPIQPRSGIGTVPEHPPRSGEPCVASFTLSVDLFPGGIPHITVYVAGRARVQFEDGAFVGTPDFQFPLDVTDVSI